MVVNRALLNIELARLGLNLTQLAGRLQTPATTLSSWLTGRHPAPADLATRIENELDLGKGKLAEPDDAPMSTGSGRRRGRRP